MATLKAKQIKDTLEKIRRVGRIEDRTVIDGCELVLQNQTPAEFESVVQSAQGFEDLAFTHAYQLGQVSRSIIEINGVDLRPYDFIEDEVPVGQWVLEVVIPNKNLATTAAAELRKLKLNPVVTQNTGTDETKSVKLERHQWIQNNFLNEWGREAMNVAWRKVTELLIRAEKVAAEGVTFTEQDETAEDKVRRLLFEIRETSRDLPDDLMNHLLGESGLVVKARQEELEAADERLSKIRTPEPPPAEAPAQAPVAPPPAPPVVEPEAPVRQSGVPSEAVRAAMAQRERLNQQGANIPALPTPASPVPSPAGVRLPVPESIRLAAEANAQLLGPRRSRAEEVAQIEAFDAVALQSSTVDGGAAKTLIDQPPPVGVNPHFNPRNRR